MPYIKQELRQLLQEGDYQPKSKGELNYVITCLMHGYILTQGKNYQTISDAISAANDAAEEFRRRIMNPYEDEKIKENGDIYNE